MLLLLWYLNFKLVHRKVEKLRQTRQREHWKILNTWHTEGTTHSRRLLLDIRVEIVFLLVIVDKLRIANYVTKLRWKWLLVDNLFSTFKVLSKIHRSKGKTLFIADDLVSKIKPDSLMINLFLFFSKPFKKKTSSSFSVCHVVFVW